MLAVDYVNPMIGTIGHLLTSTSPTVSLPHGMMKLAPITTPGIMDRYLAERIFGFPAGCAYLMPTQKADLADPSKLSSLYDHDLEHATPYAYDVLLEDEGIEAEMTAAYQSAIYRFRYPNRPSAVLVIGFPKNGSLTLLSNRSATITGTLNGVPHYTYLAFSEPVVEIGDWQSERHAGRVLRVAAEGGMLEVRAGISYIDDEQAKCNLSGELDERSFEQTKQTARETWQSALSRIEVTGGSEEQKTVFYTSLYRSLLNMSSITEDGRYYSAYDGQVHESGGRDFYVSDNIWDTYRCLHPLQLLLDSERKQDMIHSYVRMYEQCGWLPQFPFVQGDLPVMTGNHTAAFIYDVYNKGYRNFDAAKAYEAMKVNATEVTMLPWVHGPLTELDRVYLEQGFYPALRPGEKEWVKEVDGFERRQSVAVTLEHAYDDWCVAQMARELGREEDHAYFMQRSQNYRKLYNEATGFMSPKSADGEWVEKFDPKLGGGLGGRDYFSECNAWIYSFHVQHDIEGLIELMGGADRFEERLDALFAEQYDGSKYQFLGQFPDATGLMGQYCQGNEPAFHIPYLYNYTSSPWKTQRRLREIMKLWYQATPTGICGDEDNGAMSSWYVFSAMGFYPICPGKASYELGSPLFERTEIAVGGGRTFTVHAENVSGRNKYIQSAEINGKPLAEPRINHEDVAAGGILTLRMGDRPNKTWGTGAFKEPAGRMDKI
ncbi:GH92 family glycosyl hydrolase [Paenibacillus sacheonensis]|uniref:Glycoside hydrolase family 92 protein n=1 Tax=Paenibacillus sacheonensis TaxID=742054 RepID=A0A7X4YS84_9BACL|nr:GH92 family glycosyl hydrolase [Paenibacillus sacheonensis]MBM7566970.1 putative alpha-1,2-mannosidase [Paenibacillus sacheonensis]NBC71592.1 glycoside hydrolase family 92 protein [Paenibacillus sacheonensis]